MSLSSITAEEANKISIVAKRNNFQAAADRVLENAYKQIRTASCVGIFKTSLDLGLGTNLYSEETRRIVVKALKDNGYSIRIKNSWILQISWEK